MQGQYSLRSPAVKRLMKEAQELREPTEQYHAQPLEDNLFEWHFTIRGPADSDFNGGIYHGRIILPPEYPMKPPSIIILTPNGRFETNTKICLSISGHHPESWQPSWSIRTALLAIIGFMPTHGAGAMGSLDYTPEERKRLAKKSLEYKCPVCGGVKDLLRPVTEASKADSEEAKELASQIDFQGEKKRSNSDSTTEGNKENTATAPADNGSTVSSSSVSTPPWAQMPNSSSAYNPFMPFMPPVANSTRPMSAGSMPQMRPYMTFSQFAAMQPLMQQQMQQQIRGVLPPQMTMLPWGMPATRFPVSPPTTTMTGGVQMSTNAGKIHTSPSAASSSDAAGPSISKACPVTPTTSPSTEQSQSSSSSASSGSSTSSGDGLRQRTAPVQQSNVIPAASQATRSTELRQQPPPPPPSGMTQVIMIVLALAILFLLLRRLSLMGILRFDQNAEL